MPPFKEANSFAIGTILQSRYRVENKLAQGGMSEIYLGVDQKTGDNVAIKVLPIRLGDESLRARFLREAKLAERVRHPNVVETFCGGTEGSVPYLVMEHLPGETLHDRIVRGGPMKYHEARELLLEILEGIGAAHQEDVLHRDLKPSNILLTKTGVKLIDFGLSKSLDKVETSITEPQEALGTPSYMSPEQVLAEPLSHQSDLYAVGLIFFEMLSGIRAFPSHGKSPERVLDSVMFNSPPSLGAHPNQVPEARIPDVDAFIAKASAKGAGERFASAAKMASACPSAES